MMQQAVEQSRGQHLVAQERAPLREAGVTRQNDRAMFVAIATLINILQSSLLHSTKSFK